MDLTGKSLEELNVDFTTAQEQITALQALQAEIATERRRRRFEAERAKKLAELKQIEEQLNANDPR